MSMSLFFIISQNDSYNKIYHGKYQGRMLIGRHFLTPRNLIIQISPIMLFPDHTLNSATQKLLCSLLNFQMNKVRQQSYWVFRGFFSL